MARASALFGANEDFVIGDDVSAATGSGWLIDPDLNTGGVIIYSLAATASSYTTVGHIGSNKVTPTENARVWGDVNGSFSLNNTRLAPGIGLYASGDNNSVLFKYL